MKKYLHARRVVVPIYDMLVIVVITNSPKKLKKYIPEFDHPYVYAHSWCVNYENLKTNLLVLNFDNKYKKVTQGTIAHEALHITNFILEDVGVISSFRNDEASAYLLGWIVDQVYELSKKHGFKQI